MIAPLVGAPPSSQNSPTTFRYQNVHNEFVAVILAATVGTRLFPLTDVRGISKHLLPIAGVPIIKRLLQQLESSGFAECVVAIAQEDQQTIDFLRQEIKHLSAEGWREFSPSEIVLTPLAALGVGTVGPVSPKASTDDSDPTSSGQPDFSSASISMCFEISKRLKVVVVRLGEECEGSVGTINQIEATGVVALKSHIVIIPGDLVFLDGDTTAPALAELIHTHRQGQTAAQSAACTILLSDVGEQDENGVPLKESAKQKKGGFAREEDDIEYIALSYSNTTSGQTAPRVVWKQSKQEAEEDKDMTGATPKLVLPKPRLRLGDITRVRTDWSDAHVYVLSPWVRRLLWVRNGADRQQNNPLSLISLADDLLPLLITRQSLSIQETFGSKLEPAQVEELLRAVSITSDSSLSHHLFSLEPTSPVVTRTPKQHGLERFAANSQVSSNKAALPYSVLAYVQKSAFRSCSVSAYLYASRELVARVLAGGSGSSAAFLMLPLNSSIRHKFQTVILSGSTVGDKVTFKSTVVGRNCTLGNKCRLNNVILLDDVVLGENVSLQNTVVGKGAVLGDNCSLNDCQVAHRKKVPSGTKVKGEALTDDVMLDG